jgi:hypothetical protein
MFSTSLVFAVVEILAVSEFCTGVHLISISSDITCMETFDIEFHRLFSGPVIPWLDTSGLAVALFGFAETCSTYLSIMRVTVNGSQLLELVPSLLYSLLQYTKRLIIEPAS